MRSWENINVTNNVPVYIDKKKILLALLSNGIKLVSFSMEMWFVIGYFLYEKSNPADANKTIRPLNKNIFEYPNFDNCPSNKTYILMPRFINM